MTPKKGAYIWVEDQEAMPYDDVPRRGYIATASLPSGKASDDVESIQVTGGNYREVLAEAANDVYGRGYDAISVYLYGSEAASMRLRSTAHRQKLRVEWAAHILSMRRDQHNQRRRAKRCDRLAETLGSRPTQAAIKSFLCPLERSNGVWSPRPYTPVMARPSQINADQDGVGSSEGSGLALWSRHGPALSQWVRAGPLRRYTGGAGIFPLATW